MICICVLGAVKPFQYSMGKDVALGSNLISMHKKCTEQKKASVSNNVSLRCIGNPFTNIFALFFGEKSEVWNALWHLKNLENDIQVD